MICFQRDLRPNLRVNSVTVVVLCDFSPAASQWRPRCRERRNTIPICRIFVCVVADEESHIRRRLWRRGECLKRIAGDDGGAVRVWRGCRRQWRWNEREKLISFFYFFFIIHYNTRVVVTFYLLMNAYMWFSPSKAIFETETSEVLFWTIAQTRI